MNDCHAPIKLFLTAPESCPYLSELTSSSVVVDPAHEISTAELSKLTRIGFRRSGNIVYRPHCDDCNACVSVRVPVAQFSFSRSQRRNWKANRDLELRRMAPTFSEEQFQLYLRYQRQRHPGSSMCDDDPQKYREFLISSFARSCFNCLYLDDRLVCVAIADQLTDGLSAVYTFFDPHHQHRGLGTYSILLLIQQARQQGLDYLYLGYWIEGAQKMDYKRRFRPLQGLIDGAWTDLPV